MISRGGRLLGNRLSGKCPQMTLPNATLLPFGESGITASLVVGGTLFCPRTLRWVWERGAQWSWNLYRSEPAGQGQGLYDLRQASNPQTCGHLEASQSLSCGFLFSPPAVTNKNLGYPISYANGRRQGHRGVCPLRCSSCFRLAHLGRGHSSLHRLSQKQPGGLQQGSRKMKRFLPEHPALNPQGSCKEVMGRRVGNY